MKTFTIDDITHEAFAFIQKETLLIFESDIEQRAETALRISAIAEFVEYIKDNMNVQE